MQPRPEFRGVPPAAILMAGMGLTLAGLALCLGLALAQPGLGLSLQRPDQGPGLLLVNAPGDRSLRILSLHAAAVGRQTLRPDDLLEEPDFLRSYAEFNAFLDRQDRLARLLRNAPVTIESADGASWQLSPERRRPLHSLPAAFWFQAAFAVVCLGIGLAVWAYRRGVAEALFALSGTGLFVVGLSAAVYSTRELALPGGLFRTLAVVNHGGGMLFAAAFLAMLWHYPRQLGRFPTAQLSLAVFGALWLLDSLQWLPGIDFGFRYPLIAGLLLSILLAVTQWRRLTSPVDRAAMRWFAFSWLAGSSLYVGIMFVPVLFDAAPLLPQSASFALLLPLYLGVAVGVARYRLFALERWWYSALAGFAAVLVALLVIPLASRAADWAQPLTLSLALAASGWVYFPLHAWLDRRLQRRRRERELPLLAQALGVLLTPERPGDRDVLWRDLLVEVFAPMQIQRLSEAPAAARTSSDGARLETPAQADIPGFSLQWPDRGSRLFTAADLQLIGTLLPLLDHASQLRKAWEAGAAAERARIKTDLEDDLAGRLYEQILKADSRQSAHAARAALAELRLMIDQLDTRPRPAAQAIEEWRAQLADICDQAEVRLDWQQENLAGLPPLGVRERANPLRILREAVTNAITHSQPSRILVGVAGTGQALALRLEHDGASSHPQHWRKGRGMLNMQARARQLSGELLWSEPAPGHVHMNCHLSLVS